MSLALFFAGVALIFLMMGMPAFELTMAAFLLTPVFAFLVGKIYGLGTEIYYLVFLLLCGFFVCTKQRAEWRRYTWQEVKEDVWTVLVFLISLLILHQLCLKWPDFIAMGERLRDYAILASTFKSPLQPLEPWMSGSTLNYYVYWYRFGYMLGQMFGLEVWQVYHLMMAFVLAFYTTIVYRISRGFLGFSYLGALASALLISMGSNLSGIIFFLTKDTNWWGPSRVIPGAINEFPAWSFLLGDLHPHYLNLALVPFFILVFLHLFNERFKRSAGLIKQRSIILLSLMVLPPLWIFSSNPWELPMWLGLAGLCFALFAAVNWSEVAQGGIQELKARLWPAESGMNLFPLIALAILLVAAYALRASAAHIVPIESASGLTWVKSPIEKSYSWDFYLHWGFPLTVVAAALVILQKDTVMRIFTALVLLAALIFPEINVFLFSLLILNFVRVFGCIAGPKSGQNAMRPPDLLMECLGIAALGLLLLPEVVFLNDDYGGENERMNTIFKVYSFTWMIMHIFAFYLGSKCLKLDRFSWIKKEGIIGVQVLVLMLFLAFFQRTVGLRESAEQIVMPAVEGLSQVEREFPGSSVIVKELRRLPEGVVLEGQGNPYSYTTFVSTLAGRTAYLGWANHVNLLTKNYGEVSRREKMTEEIYTGKDCAQKLKLLAQEGINYIVLGSLERRQYEEMRSENKMDSSTFECMKVLIADKDYQLLSY